MSSSQQTLNDLPAGSLHDSLLWLWLKSRSKAINHTEMQQAASAGQLILLDPSTLAVMNHCISYFEAKSQKNYLSSEKAAAH